MKATAFLEKQHRKVESILDALESGNEASALLKELAENLAAHMAIEQNIFYPAVRDIKQPLVSESFEEHALAEVALKRLLKTERTDAQFGARLSVLKELVYHHVEEEEKELFPAVEKAMSPQSLEALGSKLQQAFTAAEREGFDALVPRGMSHTSADEALKLIASEAGDSSGQKGASARR